MPFFIVRNDITKMKVDAIVNAANETLLGGGGVDGAIHRAAGPALLKECRSLGGCETGKAKITGAYNLPSRYIIHTVGPRWFGGRYGEREKLFSCYRESLFLAKRYGVSTIAFPLISAGSFGYPRDQAMQIASDAITTFLQGNEMTVYLVIFDRVSFQIGRSRFPQIAAYIDDCYAQCHEDKSRRDNEGCLLSTCFPEPASYQPDISATCPEPCQNARNHLVHALSHLDESFSEMLLRKIDEKGMTDADCYKKANIDRKLFSKIRKDRLYKPSKPTAVAFAIALELSLEETKELLMKAGFALSHSNAFDIIVEYYIIHHQYNIYEINETLFSFDQNLLGTA